MTSETEGEWSPLQKTPGDSKVAGDGRGIFPIHAVLLHTGEVLWFSGHAENVHYLPESYVWDPTQLVDTATKQPFPPGVDVFCCHHATLEDGRVITVGGSAPHPDHGRGVRFICIFDPVGKTWTRIGDMSEARWYPTLVTMSDGSLTVFSGHTEPGTTPLIAPTVEWLRPPFEGQPLEPGAYVTPLFQQQPAVWTALSVSRNGAMNAIRLDADRDPYRWMGPVAFGGSHLHPGGHVTPLFQQQPAVWAALTVDASGIMNAVSLDANQNPPVWRGPVAFGSNNLVPGGHVTPLFQQQPAVWAALTVDASGIMNAVSLDANQNPPVWRGPVAFGSNNLVPGGHVTPLFQQQPGVWAALTVDKYGVMNRVWLDANAPSPTWAGPVAFGSGNLVPGAPVTPLFQERPGIWSALTVNTRMNVVSVDANATPPAWTGPVAFGSDHLAPGALVTPLFQERPGVWSALTVDKGGRANRVWLDANAPSPSWEGPEPFSSGTLVPGAPVSDFFQQQPGVWAALTVDEAGRMNVVSVDANVFPPAWSAPAPFGEPDLVPGAKVTPLFQQQPAVWAALTVDQENSMNVVRVDANQSPPPWEGPLVAGSYQPITLAGADKTLPIYPGLHLVPGGSLFYTGTTWRYEDVVSDPIGTFSFRITGPESGSWLDHQISPAVDFREEGTSVLLPPSSEGRILLLGGARADFAANGDFAGLESGSLPRSAEILDTTTIPPKWTAVPSMNDPRINANAVLLPDGKVFVHGGHGGYKWDSGTQRSNRVEIYDPVANTWSLGATSNQPRTYHSTALLLPDGRVLCAGGVDPTLPEPTTGGALNQKSFEFYSPPYFFNGPRPSIASVTNSAGAANSVHFGGVFSVMTPQAGQIGRVALMRLGAITHHTDSEQRYVALPFEQQASELRVSAPTDTTEAPPGWYMLWIVTHAGLPCQHAQIVRLSAA